MTANDWNSVQISMDLISENAAILEWLSRHVVCLALCAMRQHNKCYDYDDHNAQQCHVGFSYHDNIARNFKFFPNLCIFFLPVLVVLSAFLIVLASARLFPPRLVLCHDSTTIQANAMKHQTLDQTNQRRTANHNYLHSFEQGRNAIED
jgi:hypothetical protein